MFEKSAAPEFEIDFITAYKCRRVTQDDLDWWAKNDLAAKVTVRIHAFKKDLFSGQAKRMTHECTISRSNILLILGEYSKRPSLAMRVQRDTRVLNTIAENIHKQGGADSCAIGFVIQNQENLHFILNECLAIGWDPRQFDQKRFDSLVSYKYNVTLEQYLDKLDKPRPHSEENYWYNKAIMKKLIDSNQYKRIEKVFFEEVSDKDRIAYQVMLSDFHFFNGSGGNDLVKRQFQHPAFSTALSIRAFEHVRKTHYSKERKFNVRVLCNAQPEVMRQYLTTKILEHIHAGESEQIEESIFDLNDTTQYRSIFLHRDAIKNINAEVLMFLIERSNEPQLVLSQAIAHSLFDDHHKLESLLNDSGFPISDLNLALLKHRPKFYGNYIANAIMQEAAHIDNGGFATRLFNSYTDELIGCFKHVDYTQAVFEAFCVWYLSRDQFTEQTISQGLILFERFAKLPKDEQTHWLKSVAKNWVSEFIQGRYSNSELFFKASLQPIDPDFYSYLLAYAFVDPDGLKEEQAVQAAYDDVNVSLMLPIIAESFATLTHEQAQRCLYSLITFCGGRVERGDIDGLRLLMNDLRAQMPIFQQPLASVVEQLCAEKHGMVDCWEQFFWQGLCYVVDQTDVLHYAFVNFLLLKQPHNVIALGDENLQFDFTKISALETVLLNRKLNQDQRLAMIDTLSLAIQESEQLRAKISDETYAQIVNIIGQKTARSIEMPVLDQPYALMHAVCLFLVRLEDRAIDGMLKQYQSLQVGELYKKPEDTAVPIMILKQVLTIQHKCYAKAISILSQNDEACFELMSVHQGCETYEQDPASSPGLIVDLEHINVLKENCAEIFAEVKSLTDVTKALVESSVNQQKLIESQGRQIAELGDKLDRALKLLAQLTPMEIDPPSQSDGAIAGPRQ